VNQIVEAEAALEAALEAKKKLEEKRQQECLKKRWQRAKVRTACSSLIMECLSAAVLSPHNLLSHSLISIILLFQLLPTQKEGNGATAATNAVAIANLAPVQAPGALAQAADEAAGGAPAPAAVAAAPVVGHENHVHFAPGALQGPSAPDELAQLELRHAERLNALDIAQREAEIKNLHQQGRTEHAMERMHQSIQAVNSDLQCHKVQTADKFREHGDQLEELTKSVKKLNEERDMLRMSSNDEDDTHIDLMTNHAASGSPLRHHAEEQRAAAGKRHCYRFINFFSFSQQLNCSLFLYCTIFSSHCAFGQPRYSGSGKIQEF